MVEESEVTAGDKAILCCPLCGQGISHPETHEKMPLNVDIKCGGCKKIFSVRKGTE